MRKTIGIQSSSFNVPLTYINHDLNLDRLSQPFTFSPTLPPPPQLLPRLPLLHSPLPRIWSFKLITTMNLTYIQGFLKVIMTKKGTQLKTTFSDIGLSCSSAFNSTDRNRQCKYKFYQSTCLQTFITYNPQINTRIGFIAFIINFMSITFL